MTSPFAPTATSFSETAVPISVARPASVAVAGRKLASPINDAVNRLSGVW